MPYALIVTDSLSSGDDDEDGGSDDSALEASDGRSFPKKGLHFWLTLSLSLSRIHISRKVVYILLGIMWSRCLRKLVWI